MNNNKINKLLVFVLFLLVIVIIFNTITNIFNTITIKRMNENNINYEEIKFEAETMEEIEALKKYKKPIIVVFGADYCPTCRNYMPYVKEMYAKYKDKIIIKHIDTVEHKAIRKLYNIEFIPSTIFYDKNGDAYKPSEEINVNESNEKAEERKYQSDNIMIKTGEELGLNNKFEYGQDESGKIVYTKYTGLIDMDQFEKIIEELLQQ